MTDNEIIKALECCARSATLSACDDCPFKSTGSIMNIACANLENFTLDLINRQKAEIERLQADYLSMQETLSKMSLGVEQAKTEAVKELAEMIKTNTFAYSDDECYFDAVAVKWIDKCVKKWQVLNNGKSKENH